MSTLINPITITTGFGLLLSVLALLKPQTARIILGVFFLVMAIGVNVPITLIDANLYVAAGENALLPLYRWFFTTILAWNPVVFAVPLILFEMAVGILTLSKGRAAKWGLMGAIFFCLAITPVGMEEIGAPVIALAAGLMLRHEYDRSVIEMAAGLFKRRATA